MLNENKYELIKFEDGDFSLDVNVSPKEETVWLSLDGISELFERDKSVISRHIKNIFSDFELSESAVVAFFATAPWFLAGHLPWAALTMVKTPSVTFSYSLISCTMGVP